MISPTASLKIQLLVAFLAPWILPFPGTLSAQEQEEILSYDVIVEVRDGGFLTITENIEVRILGVEIRRGIYRDFPTRFPREGGLGWVVAPFQVLSVSRDGVAEPYRVETLGGPAGRSGVRVRIGDAGILLSHGVHRYTMVYETARWVSFGRDVDRFDWNVTGNGWEFAILSAAAEVRFPESAPEREVDLDAWTGPEGSTVQDANWIWDASAGTARFRTTEPLGRREGLTVRVTFPKGLVSPPTEEQEAGWFRLDYGGFIDVGMALALVLAVYLLMWVRVGRDPASGTIVVQYEPPEGFSPAALGFLRERGHAPAQLTAALVSLAVKGALTLEKDGRKWRVEPTSSFNGFLPAEERRLFEGLVGGGRTVVLSGSSNSRLRAGVKAYQAQLKRSLEKTYFVTNRKWFASGVAVSLIAVVVLFWRSRYTVPPEAWMMGSWLTAWTMGLATLLYRTVLAWKQTVAGEALAWVGALFMTLFTVPFLGAEIAVGYLLYQRLPRHLLVALVALGLLNVLFYHLLERPTLKGRGVLDHLEWFRRFLGATEEDRMDLLQPPDRSLELFEAFLPHAIALGVGNRWAERFQTVLTASEAASSQAMSWYSGGGAGRDLSGMTSTLAHSLSSSLSSSSAPPPSRGGSGGSGGGGFSGGGGGGGGGGGW
jgi:uncharacterized membrane protein YgcG